MWVMVPAVYLSALQKEIDLHCRLLTECLRRNGYRPQVDPPQVEVD